MSPSKTTSFRLGTRADAQLDRLAHRLDLNRSDVVRLSLSHLEKTPGDTFDAVAAHAAARRVLDRLIADHGELAQLQVDIAEDCTSDVLHPKVLRRASSGSEPADGLHAYARVNSDHSVAIDLYDYEEDVTIRDVRTNPELPTGGLTMVIPIRAIHVSGPVPPIADETVTDGPDGREMTTYHPDGSTVHYLLRPGHPPNVVPHRRAELGERGRQQAKAQAHARLEETSP